MIGSLLNIFKIPELRTKVMVTLGLLLVYRIGAHVPTPFIDAVKLQDYSSTLGGGALAVVDMFSGGAFKQMTIFALGIMPYISASIIIQLLTVVWPRLEKISKEGEAGRRKITQWTRYGTVVLALFQGMGIGVFLRSQGLSILPPDFHFLGFLPSGFVFLILTAITMCTGTCFIMWLGEKITQYGIGNGISLIIAIGIIARYPIDVATAVQAVRSQTMVPMLLVLLIAAMIAVTILIIVMTLATRKVPVQHARRMVGRKMMQGGNTNIPLKLNTAGVIPVIFASALLSFPGYILPYFGNQPGSFGHTLGAVLQINSNYNPYYALNMTSGGIFNLFKVINVYTFIYVVLTVFFCYFYTAITLNPVDLADNLKKSGAFIPGIKPGKPTADYVNYILVRITTVGALMLIGVALVPEVLHVSFNIPYMVASMAGGTGLIIVVGVILDTMKQIESQLMMRHYDGFGGGGGGLSGGKSRQRLTAGGGPVRLSAAARTAGGQQ